LPTGRTLDIAIPAGTRSGQTIRLRGQGRLGVLGGASGDALITVEIAPHPVFRIDGDNLRRDVTVGLDEAVLGAKLAAGDPRRTSDAHHPAPIDRRRAPSV
jgi:DnaJ-class molecular chaperone